MPSGLRNVDPPVRARTGWVASRVGLDLRHPRGDQRRGARHRAQMNPRHHGPGRQRRVAIGKCQLCGAKPAMFAGAGNDLRPVQHVRQVAAIGAGVHRHRAADRSRNTGQELQPRQSSGGRMFRDGHIQRRGAGDDAVRLGD